MSNISDTIKQFSMNSNLIEYELDQIEIAHSVDLGRGNRNQVESDESYYPQIELDIRSEAAKMAPHYEMFYSLEKTVRRLVVDTLKAAAGASWWDSGRIPEKIKADAESLQAKEIDTGITPRSDEPIDFCTFGELGDIITSNWDVFASIFSSQKAVNRVMARLNTLRAPIAHCSLLADDEIVRLKLTVRDWFRLME